MRPTQLTAFGGVAVVAAQAVGDQHSSKGSQQLPSGDFAPTVVTHQIHQRAAAQRPQPHPPIQVIMSGLVGVRHRRSAYRRANLRLQRFQPLGELTLTLADRSKTERELPAVLQVGLYLAQTHPVLTVEQADLADQPGAHLTSGHPLGLDPDAQVAHRAGDHCAASCAAQLAPWRYRSTAACSTPPSLTPIALPALQSALATPPPLDPASTADRSALALLPSCEPVGAVGESLVRLC